MEELLGCTGFEWDEANIDKNWLKPLVSWTECEEVLFNQPLIVAKDETHSFVGSMCPIGKRKQASKPRSASCSTTSKTSISCLCGA